MLGVPFESPGTTSPLGCFDGWGFTLCFGEVMHQLFWSSRIPKWASLQSQLSPAPTVGPPEFQTEAQPPSSPRNPAPPRLPRHPSSAKKKTKKDRPHKKYRGGECPALIPRLQPAVSAASLLLEGLSAPSRALCPSSRPGMARHAR